MEQTTAPRHMIAECSDLKATLFLVGPAPDLAKTQIDATLWDLGPEGAGFVCPWDRALLSLPPRQHLELLLTYAGEPTVLDGELAYCRKSAGGRAVTLGMGFLDTLRGYDGKAQLPRLLEQFAGRGLVRPVPRR